MQFRVGSLKIGRSQILIAGASFLLLILIVVLLLIIRGASADSDSDGPESGLFPWASAERLYVPDELERGVEPSWYPSRDTRERWNPEEISGFWIDPATIGIDVLDEQIEGQVEALFATVP